MPVKPYPNSHRPFSSVARRRMFVPPRASGAQMDEQPLPHGITPWSLRSFFVDRHFGHCKRSETAQHRPATASDLGKTSVCDGGHGGVARPQCEVRRAFKGQGECGRWFVGFVGFVEFVGFVGFVGFVEFIGFVGFVEFVEFVGFVEFIGFVESIAFPGSSGPAG